MSSQDRTDRHNRQDQNGRRSMPAILGWRPSRWLRQSVLNVGLVGLAASAVCGKQLLLHFSLLTGGGICPSPPVRNLTLTDIYLTGTGAGLKALRVEWDGDAGATFSVQRTPGPITAGTITNTGGHGVLVDIFAAQAGTKYVYSATQTDPPPPPPPYPYTACTPAPSTPVSINVTPVQVTVADNQSVDARYDPRYALWTYLNHNFGATVYRGGLSVGYNADNSQVGHAYLKFALPPVPQGQSVWAGAGSVNAYYLRSYAPGSTVVACQSVPTSWTGPTVTWSTAPAFNTGNATASQQATVSYGSQQPVPLPNTGWTHWGMGSDIIAAIPSGTYGSALGSPGEPSTASNPISGAASGWVYFSKKEYAPGQPSCVLYAYSN